MGRAAAPIEWETIYVRAGRQPIDCILVKRSVGMIAAETLGR